MVEYKKKKIQLKNGGSRNYYYKELSNGKKEQISKEVYLSKKGGTLNEEKITIPPEIVKRLVELRIVSPKSGLTVLSHNKQLKKIQEVYNTPNKLEKLVSELEQLPIDIDVPRELQNEDKIIINRKRNQLNTNKKKEEFANKLAQKYKSKRSERERLLSGRTNYFDYFDLILTELGYDND